MLSHESEVSTAGDWKKPAWHHVAMDLALGGLLNPAQESSFEPGRA